jgi:hypothetical protein
MHRDEIKPQGVDDASDVRRKDLIAPQGAKGAHRQLVIALRGDAYPVVSGPLWCRGPASYDDALWG